MSFLIFAGTGTGNRDRVWKDSFTTHPVVAILPMKKGPGVTVTPGDVSGFRVTAEEVDVTIKQRNSSVRRFCFLSAGVLESKDLNCDTRVTNLRFRPAGLRCGLRIFARLRMT